MRVVSLFSGAGGLDLGFIKAGHEIVWANDMDEAAIKTYRYNIGEHIHCQDISKVCTSSIPDADIVIGGFPCQGFSVANKYRSEDDTRNQLYVELLRVIQEKQPSFFVMENVPGLLSLSKGQVFELILQDIINSGYKVTYQVLNSADYGVPQKRKRVIIFGVRKDLDYVVPFPEPCYFEEKLPQWKTVRSAIGDLPLDFSTDIANHMGTKHKVKINGYIGNRAIDWDKPSPTIVGRGGGTGGPVIHPHPELHRRMTVRETARLQSFPDDFIFQGSVSAQYRQIGNAVPVQMAYYIAKQFPLEF